MVLLFVYPPTHYFCSAFGSHFVRSSTARMIHTFEVCHKSRRLPTSSALCTCILHLNSRRPFVSELRSSMYPSCIFTVLIVAQTASGPLPASLVIMSLSTLVRSFSILLSSIHLASPLTWRWVAHRYGMYKAQACTYIRNEFQSFLYHRVSLFRSSVCDVSLCTRTLW